MAIKKKDQQSRMIIDLDGYQGNAYVLLGYAQNFSKQLGIDFTNQVKPEMTQGNYSNLIQVFDKYFGEFCDLTTNNHDLLQD